VQTRIKTKDIPIQEVIIGGCTEGQGRAEGTVGASYSASTTTTDSRSSRTTHRHRRRRRPPVNTRWFW
jgi:hypothetical protein